MHMLLDVLADLWGWILAYAVALAIAIALITRGLDNGRAWLVAVDPGSEPAE